MFSYDVQIIWDYMRPKIITTFIALVLILKKFIFNSKLLFDEKLCYVNHQQPFACKYIQVRIKKNTYRL